MSPFFPGIEDFSPLPATWHRICFPFLSGLKFLLSLCERRIWTGWQALFLSHRGSQCLAPLRESLDLLPCFHSSSWTPSRGLWQESMSECKLSEAPGGFILSSYPILSLKQFLRILADFFFTACITVLNFLLLCHGDPFLWKYLSILGLQATLLSCDFSSLIDTRKVWGNLEMF